MPPATPSSCVLVWFRRSGCTFASSDSVRVVEGVQLARGQVGTHDGQCPVLLSVSSLEGWNWSRRTTYLTSPAPPPAFGQNLLLCDTHTQPAQRRSKWQLLLLSIRLRARSSSQLACKSSYHPHCSFCERGSKQFVVAALLLTDCSPTLLESSQLLSTAR